MYVNLDCDHPLVKKVVELSKQGKKYKLEEGEQHLAKMLVEREFLYYAGDYEHVCARDLRKYNVSVKPSESSAKNVDWDDID